jgi:peptide deformylase
MIRIKAQDWLARVFQHEIDHLDGVLFIDRAKEIWRSKPPEGQEPPDDPLEGLVEEVKDKGE